MRFIVSVTTLCQVKTTANSREDICSKHGMHFSRGPAAVAGLSRDLYLRHRQDYRSIALTAAFQIGNMACHSVAEVWPGFYCGWVVGQWSVNLALGLYRLTGI